MLQHQAESLFPVQKGSSMTLKQENMRSAGLDEAVRLFGEAWAGGDIAKLEELLSPSYTHIDYFGEFHDRAGWLDYARRRTRLRTRISFRDVRTRIFGDVAIVTGTNDLDYIGDSGTSNESRSVRFTQVWVWQEGRWLREAFQATAVPENSSFEL
jgi:ketosteroid isomerase-like protein